MAVVADPEGAVICVWQPRAHRYAQLVNEPGTWNFSELTRDPARAETFYGAVFGWRADEVGAGEVVHDVSPPRLRGPSRGPRSRHAPPHGGGRRARGLRGRGRVACADDRRRFPEDAPAHWSITFAVDNADAVAERAARLGGTVLVPPLDAPWVRMTVVHDPQGAVFTARRFTPSTQAASRGRG
jgi:predicted enzyme related to lactoylglutathione lyase